MTAKTNEIWELTQKGENFFQLGDYQKAIEIFSNIIEKEPSAWVYAHLGEAYRLNGSPDEAIDNFRQATELKKDYAWAYAHWGETLRLRGKDYKPAARELFTKALEINPNYIWAIAHRGTSYYLHNPEELIPALTELDKAISLYDKYAWAIAFRSVIYLLLGEETLAYRELFHAIKLDNTIISSDAFIQELDNVLEARILASKTESLSKLAVQRSLSKVLLQAEPAQSLQPTH